jgi:hypothetical protein
MSAVAHNSPSPPHRSAIYASNSRAYEPVRLECYTSILSFTELLKGLVSEFFKLTKDGSLFSKFHRNMQLETQEHECVQALEVQLLLFKKVVNFSSSLLADVQDDSAQLDIASHCRKNAVSILLDAEASIGVIKGFLAQAGHTSPISYVV